MIENDSDIPVVVAEINERLQALHDYLGDRNIEEAKIRFPRGYLRTCAHHRAKYSFITNSTLKKNIAYAKLTTDIYRWLLNRTDLAITAKEMIAKQGIVLLCSVAEAIVHELAKGKPNAGRDKPFKVRLSAIATEHDMPEELIAELEWLWDTRSKVHLTLAKTPEFGVYELKDYNRAVKALAKLRVSLGGVP